MPREPKPFDRHEIKKIGESLSKLSSEAHALADALEKADFDEPLWVDAGDGVYLGMQYTVTWLSKLKAAHLGGMLPRGNGTAKADAQEAAKPKKVKVARGKKKITDSITDSGSA